LVAAAEKIRIKSLGLMLLLIFPGALVEPDEEQFKKSKPKTRMRVAAVGSFANFIVAILLVITIIGMGWLSSAIFIGKGAVFSETIQGTPAYEVGLEGVITEIDGQKVNSVEDLTLILDSVPPGEEIKILTTEGDFTLETVSSIEDQEKSYIGISNVKTDLYYKGPLEFLGNARMGESIYFWFFGLFNWALILNIAVGVVNLLPILPFDGGLIQQALFEKIFKKETANKVVIGLSILTASLIILNMVGTNTIISRINSILALI
jgi:membrane-associated protease RseP (regulator of RpoE activity)